MTPAAMAASASLALCILSFVVAVSARETPAIYVPALAVSALGFVAAVIVVSNAPYDPTMDRERFARDCAMRRALADCQAEAVVLYPEVSE